MTQTSISFRDDAATTLRELRLSLAAILEHLRPPVGRPTDLGRLLQLDNRLSWRIFNAATAEDPLSITPLVPGHRAMERFLSAAAVHGAPPAAIARARAAFQRFEEAVRRHARRRDVFAAMVSALSEEREALSAGEDEKHKREAFRHASVLLGREARLAYSGYAFHPSAVQGRLDLTILSGMIGLHRTRGDAPLASLVQYGKAPRPGESPESITREALDPGAGEEGPANLLREFCSKPLPRFHFKSLHDGNTLYELAPEGLGATSEVTYFAAQVMRACAKAGARLDSFKLMNMPVEVSVHDVLIHESAWDQRLPELFVYYVQGGRPIGQLDESDIMPLNERVAYLGRGADPGRTPLIPRYAEMWSYALARLGWKAEEMHLFRCRVNYPLLSSAIELRFVREGPV